MRIYLCRMKIILYMYVYCYFFYFQGDRFGGVLDVVVKQFFDVYISDMIFMEFVNNMRKEGKFIMGIGYRVKFVSVG